MIAFAPQVEPLKAPFPYAGGKSRIASEVWSRLGDCPNFCEPFAGSLAVLLARPHTPHVETVNDMCAFLTNFWRALKNDPEGVAEWCDWPVNELDSHARHGWLVNAAYEQVERLREDPDFYDVKIAGWWLWGICQWIGSGWCRRPDWQPRPALGTAGMGVNAYRTSQKMPHVGNPGRGVHRTTQQIPFLYRPGMGIHALERENALLPYFYALAERLRRVRVCCGDWSRVCGPSPTFHVGLTGVFLDPPYGHSERDSRLYAQDHDVSADVRAWALENGDNPLLRIAVCGYESEFSTMPDGWTCYRWKAAGGYGNQGEGRGRENAKREVCWFSPFCLKPTQQTSLFGGEA